MSKQVFVVIGAQGSGKSTQAERLAKRLGFTRFESGEILRGLALKDEHLRDFLKTGNLLTDENIAVIVERFVEDNSSATGFVFDGFPRTITQGPILKQLAEKYGWKVVGVNIVISDETAKLRLSKRVSVVDGKETVRDDDRPEIVEKRLRVYHERTEPILSYFKENFSLIKINGEPDRDAVTSEINAVLAHLLDG
ncbi:hypothetical protein A3A71_02525 [Candidatus Berkelbacteria bacterium RIFCSPLOWO2_01_FULL_50_28]|uniref:Adenylate kinase n=1 Tax=Candidatus Berkelbacteria bacterium RIFCSPLOWO2_01_FULL_50_28 TaxID=1797471 RepID=A0A1F5EC98_9BACT|nr:MAG: hypothetical protein A2807_00920 [Candidatus Berkelbacteria bacterium RIFCSPHIGHO2_01_FULL_50_36]OGD62253.1 MAG: hypothetical protein A3F39_00940 [Candidatus Berkelbacteria bacterium RIFCSPHIGHO2_12_FULL_50_11]OGD64896.1 MAG: hypothetical protein A3A71_02525 [Candidatus Berkelbacteria bacterium RIFCSPLOWO2_01_FULL_50_28]